MKSNVIKLIICAKINHDGLAPVTVDGNCMFPLICDRDTVIIAPKHHYKVGDVVLVYVSQSLRVHRIVKIADGIFYTKGDHSLFVDPIDQHIPKIIGLVAEDITKCLKLYRVPVISKLMSYVSIFESSVRKRYGVKAHIACFDKLVTYLGYLELQYCKCRKTATNKAM